MFSIKKFETECERDIKKLRGLLIKDNQGLTIEEIDDLVEEIVDRYIINLIN